MRHLLTARFTPPSPVLPLVGVLLVAALLRGWEWTARGLWFDEAFTWRLVAFPFEEMMDRAARDNSPPLYFALLSVWVRAFGDSLASLRGLSAVFGVGAVGGMYLFAREALGGRRAALFVAALTATSAFQVRYSAEVRPYALGAALAAVSAWTLVRATRPGPPSVRAWVGYGIAALAFAYTHYYALFVLAAHAAYVGGRQLAAAGWRPPALLRAPELRCALLAGGIVVVGWLPWVPTFLRQQAQVRADFWAPPVTNWTLPELCYQMFVDPQPLGSGTPSRWAALLTAGVCGVGLAALARRARSADWLILLAAVGPFALAVLASGLGTRTLCLRYFLFAHLFLLAGVGALVWRIRCGPVRLALAGVLLAANTAATVGFLHGLHLPEHPGARGAAEFLATHREPGEPVVAASPLWSLPVAYHLGDAVRVYHDPRTAIPHYFGTAALAPADMIDLRGLENTTANRVWVVGGRGGCWGRQEVPVPAGWVLRESHSFPEALRVGTAVVLLYERVGATAPPEGE